MYESAIRARPAGPIREESAAHPEPACALAWQAARGGCGVGNGRGGVGERRPGLISQGGLVRGCQATRKRRRDRQRLRQIKRSEHLKEVHVDAVLCARVRAAPKDVDCFRVALRCEHLVEPRQRKSNGVPVAVLLRKPHGLFHRRCRRSILPKVPVQARLVEDCILGNAFLDANRVLPFAAVVAVRATAAAPSPVLP